MREALENLDKDRAFLKNGGVFDDDFIDSYIELKMTEVERFEMGGSVFDAELVIEPPEYRRQHLRQILRD